MVSIRFIKGDMDVAVKENDSFKCGMIKNVPIY